MGNRVCDALGIEYPVIQGAMAWTSMGPLVGAVSAVGGLGTLGSGFMPKEVILMQMDIVRKMTDKPFAANIFLDPGPQLEVGVSAVLEGKPAAVYIDTLNLLEYDFTKKYYDTFHEAGIKVVAKINYLEDAVIAAKAGADVIICKGLEGGGHVTKVSGRVLLAEVVDTLPDVPVVASGGIVTPRQAAACTVAGADGIEMGTAFVATVEAPVHPNAKQAIVDAIDRDAVVCGQSTGEPSWQLRNELSDELMKIESENAWTVAADMVRQATMGSLRRGSTEGEVKFRGSVFAGQACGLVHDIAPVAERVQKFCAEWQEWLKKEYKLF